MTRIAAVRQKQKQAASCSKCDGTGIIPDFAYVNGGRCYDCRGTGIGPSGLVACGDG